MKASFLRNVVIVFAFLVIVNSTAAALDFPLSIGLGLDVIPSLAYGKAITKEEYSKPISDWSWSESSNIMGVYVFFDARYVELNIGVSIFETSSSKYKFEIHEADTTYINEKVRDVSGTLLDFSLLGKYPFDIGRKKIFSIAPAIGVDYRMFIDRKGYYDGGAADLNTFVINTGAVGDFNFPIPIYLRLSFLVGYRFPSEREKSIGNKYTKFISGGTTIGPWDDPVFGTFEAKLKLAVGFKLNKSGNTLSEKPNETLELETE